MITPSGSFPVPLVLSVCLRLSGLAQVAPPLALGGAGGLSNPALAFENHAYGDYRGEQCQRGDDVCCVHGPAPAAALLAPVVRCVLAFRQARDLPPIAWPFGG